ncbi:hypothetical protein ACQ4N7_20215 [Nodosilinea sp. AN01ver1]|uniref:hypothetical protein n=1 Tax=Nodosilinea sp. AN01ver1 TaxID=3423362 RepID=UPI003D31EDB6
MNAETQRVVVETPSGSMLSINPAACPRKTVYTTQAIPIAVGDRLKWTRNNSKAGIRNGQGFVVTGLEADGTAMIQDGAGQTTSINLSGNQYVDYAWVNTTYSSQGKTAERVLALLGETTNREAFYVAISRAKRALTLYTTSQADLVRLAQVSRDKENVSDYVSLTQQVMTYGQHEQREQRQPELIPSFDPGAVGERIGQRVAEQLRAAAGRDLREYAAGVAPRRPRPDLGRGVGDVAAALEPELGVLGRAIAAYRQRRDLVRCAGDLAGAVTAVNCGLEQLERAAQDRTGFAAAVDRVVRAVGRQNRWQQKTQRPEDIGVGEAPILIEANAGTGEEIQSPSSPSANLTRERYSQMWQRYFGEVSCSNPAELDFKVGRRAFEAGVSQKEIALMLAAGSPTVKHMMQEQRKAQAIQYVNQVAGLSCQKLQQRVQPKVNCNHQIGLGD